MRTITPFVRRALAVAPVLAFALGGGVDAAAARSSTEPPAPASDEFCAAAWQIRDAAGAIDGFTEESDANSVQQGYEDLAASTGAARDAAPPELAEGLGLLAGQAGVALAVMEANGFDVTTTAADPRWEALFEFERAAGLSEHDSAVEAYVEANCVEPTLTSADPDPEAICDAVTNFETATDTFGEAVADEELEPTELQRSFTDYFAEIDRLIESGPDELAGFFGEWRGIIESYEALLTENDWDVVAALTDPQMVAIHDDISALDSESPAPGVEGCDEPTDTTGSTSETTIG